MPPAGKEFLTKRSDVEGDAGDRRQADEEQDDGDERPWAAPIT
jgi:hypothetical protein